MDERQLEQIANRLGEEAAQKLDVEQTARAVLERLRVEPVRVVWWRRMPVLRTAAAAAVVVLTAGILITSQLGSGAGEVVLLPAPEELDVLSVEELEEVFDSLAFDAPVYELAAARLEDLNDAQLRELLQLMEG